MGLYRCRRYCGCGCELRKESQHTAYSQSHATNSCCHCSWTINSLSHRDRGRSWSDGACDCSCASLDRCRMGDRRRRVLSNGLATAWRWIESCSQVTLRMFAVHVVCQRRRRQDKWVEVLGASSHGRGVSGSTCKFRGHSSPGTNVSIARILKATDAHLRSGSRRVDC